MTIALDTETTGLDLRHGAKPFLVTVCNEDGTNTWWEWSVDPLTRIPSVPIKDLREVKKLIVSQDLIILQNTKFDVTGLLRLFRANKIKLTWPWHKTVDTLVAGHLLASNHPHTLEAMCVEFLGVGIGKHEKILEKAVKRARTIAKRDYPDWYIAKKGLPGMPSTKSKVWKNDLWLLKAVASQEQLEPNHPWWTLCANYANVDSAATIALWHKQEQLLKERDLWDIYCDRLKLPPVFYKMEDRGVTINRERLDRLVEKFKVKSHVNGKVCVNIAESYNIELTLPKSGNNGSLIETVFGKDSLNLPPIKYSEKTNKPSLDRETLEHFETTLPAKTKKLAFVRNLLSKRKLDTAINYMEGYERFWKPLLNGSVSEEWYVLHPNLNLCGADTLRCSSSNPNEQNISKKEGVNLRYCFGPAPGREWWSLDAQNVEIRIPAFEANEKELVYIFEHSSKAPYYGSYHMVIVELLYSELFKQYGVEFKKKYASTLYQYTKNGNFATIYGAQEAKADATYHVQGAYRKIRKRFPRIAALSTKLFR
jgi:DNA polymerase I-like protein with 3'-5' exonuclease and polymerase domains